MHVSQRPLHSKPDLLRCRVMQAGGPARQRKPGPAAQHLTAALHGHARLNKTAGALLGRCTAACHVSCCSRLHGVRHPRQACSLIRVVAAGCRCVHLQKALGQEAAFSEAYRRNRRMQLDGDLQVRVVSVESTTHVPVHRLVASAGLAWSDRS